MNINRIIYVIVKNRVWKVEVPYPVFNVHQHPKEYLLHVVARFLCGKP